MDNLTFQTDDGYVAYKIDNNMCYIDFVQATEQHQGHGTRLVNDFIKDTSICNTFFVEVYFNRDLYDEDTEMTFERLVSFYENLGFIKDEEQWELVKDTLEDQRIFMTKII